MSVHYNSHAMHHFLRNKEMNELYISYGLFNFALGLISVFLPIYLYELGYSISDILFFFFLTSLGFVLFSYSGAKFVARFGVKHTMLATAPIFILFFIGLSYIERFPVLFYILPILRAFKMMLYNYSFHLNFVQHSDKKRRGREFSMTQASATFAGILSPLAGGIIIKFTNFPTLFAVGSVFLFAAMIPLFLTRDTYEKISFGRKNILRDIFKKDNLHLLYSFSGYAVESWIGLILWPIFLSILMFSTESIGAITSITTLLTFMIFYFIGRATDLKSKRKLLQIGTFLYFFGWVGRIFVTGLTSVIFVDTYKSLTQNVLAIPWSTRFYDIAAKGDYFRMIVHREIVFNLSRLAVLPIIMLLFFFDLKYAFALAFGIAACASLFYVAINKETV